MPRRPQLVSIGYEGRDADALIEELATNGVNVLVDVRLNPISRKPGLSKTKLAQALASRGIRYVHHRELGNPKENRDGFRQGTPASRDRFERILQGQSAGAALHHVSELLDGEVVALLCFERDHGQCHRRLVADALRETSPAIDVTML